LLVLCHASGDLLPVTGEGDFLGIHGAFVRFAEIPTDALDVAAHRGAVSHGTRGLVSMVGHGARSSRGEHHTTLSVGLAGRCAATFSGAAPRRRSTTVRVLLSAGILVFLLAPRTG
jgi:hypothetical protein